MKRSELEHVIRACSAIVEDNELVVVGSQAILGQFPLAPAELLLSLELDVYPRNKPELSIVIDGAIGEHSSFHHTFGYYAHGVSPETAVLPHSWESRLIPVRNENTRDATGWCLEAHDLAVSKVVAGRDKDRDFVAALLKHRMAEGSILKDRLLQLDLDKKRIHELEDRLKRWMAEPT